MQQLSKVAKYPQGVGAKVRSLVLGLIVLSAGAGPAAAHSLKDLEGKLLKRERYVQMMSKKAPGFTLKDAAGNPVSLSDFAGKVVVLYFVYTQCIDVCPLHSEVIASIQEAINPTPMKDLVQFVSITTDPKRDTPAIMKSYGADHGLKSANWTFLTSGPNKLEATRQLANRYGLKFTQMEGDYLMHGVVTHLIDKSGNLRARYHGLKFNETNLIVHINALSNDTH
jgi:protein SCO1/2